MGFRNHLQTRRDYTHFYNNGRFQSANEDPSQTYTFAGMNTYVDVFHNDPEFNRSISNLYNELFFPSGALDQYLDGHAAADHQ